MKYNCIYVLITSIMLGSCSNFDEYNTDPDSTNTVTSEMLATNALTSTFLLKGEGQSVIGQNALPKFVALSYDCPRDQYNSIGSCSFSSYSLMPNLDKMKEYSEGLMTETSFKALADFINAYNFYRLTMMTGDIPCSQANKAFDGIRKPVYDPQKEVFEYILSLLDNADKLFAVGKQFGGDLIYDGDTDKWRKATNALRLKVLISLSKKVTSEQKTLFADIVKNSPLMENNTDNLRIVYTKTSGTWHPLYNQTLFNPYTLVSTVVVDEMIRLKDRRLFYIAEPAPAELINGKNENDFDAYVGADPSDAVETLNVNHSNGMYSLINERYTLEQAGDPLLILSYSEQCFVIAEAIELGWLSGNSRDYYEKGVKAAMQLFASYDENGVYSHGVTIDDKYIAEYLSGNAAYQRSKEERLKQIWMQKYFIKFLQDGTDAYFDFRRTKYPELPLNPETNMNIDNKNGFPMRWTYPSEEYQTNEENINEALKRQFTNGYDGTNELMWLLKD